MSAGVLSACSAPTAEVLEGPFSEFVLLQVPTFNTTLRGRVLLDLFSEPDIFNIKWDQLQAYNGIVYPALPDLYGPTMNVSASILRNAQNSCLPSCCLPSECPKPDLCGTIWSLRILSLDQWSRQMLPKLL